MIDPIQQAIDVVKKFWPEAEPEKPSRPSSLDAALAKAMEAQDDKDWLVASAFLYKTLDSPKAFVILLWRHLGSGDTIAKIQIKPVLVHWNVNTDQFTVVDITRIE